MKLPRKIQTSNWRLLIGGLFVFSSILLVGLINLFGFLDINQAQSRELASLTEIESNISTINSRLEERLKSRVLWYTVSSSLCLVVSCALVVILIAGTAKKERMLYKALRDAEKAMKVHTYLIEHVSHKIRTPLNTVSSSVDLMKPTELSPYQRDALEVLESSMEAITVIISDILDSTVVEYGKLGLDPESISLNEFLTSLYRGLRPLAYTNNLIMTFDWPRAHNLGIDVDPLRLRQVLHNLLSNAINSNDRGSIKLSVVAEESPNDTVKLTFSVTASGSELLKEQTDFLNRAFSNPSQSIASRATDMDLGLFISMAIVHSMEGVLHVRSDYDKGSTFSFSVNLPLLYSENNWKFKPHRDPVRAHSGEGESVKKLSSVLIVDDMAVNRLIVKTILENYGLSPDQAGNGREAIKAVQSRPYDLVLMDIIMPEIDGFEATRLIRALELEKQPVIIAMTAHVLDSCKEKSYEVGMNAFLPKPFSLEDFQNTLEKFFDLGALGQSVIKLRQEKGKSARRT